jgi:hypothetical protein
MLTRQEQGNLEADGCIQQVLVRAEARSARHGDKQARRTPASCGRTVGHASQGSGFTPAFSPVRGPKSPLRSPLVCGALQLRFGPWLFNDAAAYRTQAYTAPQEDTLCGIESGSSGAKSCPSARESVQFAQKGITQGDISRSTGCGGVVFPGWSMAILFPRLRLCTLPGRSGHTDVQLNDRQPISQSFSAVKVGLTASGVISTASRFRAGLGKNQKSRPQTTRHAGIRCTGGISLPSAARSSRPQAVQN